MSAPDESRVELADAVQLVRDELLAAAQRSAGQDVVFELGDIHMEFTVEIRKEYRARAGIKAWVVDASADGTRVNSRTHKVSFILRAQDSHTGAPLKISNESEGSVDVFGRDTISRP